MQAFKNRQDAEARLNAINQLLRNTDYKALKASEGVPSEDWSQIKINRQAWRDEINAINAIIDSLPDELDDAAPGADELQ